MRSIFLFFFFMLTHHLFSQNKPYYYQIPDTPATYTAETVAARMVDGLGFRYFWATEGLTEKNLSFSPSDSARTLLQTIEHIYGLTNVLLNAVNKQPTKPNPNAPQLSFEKLREQTLLNIQKASEILKQKDTKLEDLDMIFERSNGSTRYPFWNLVNGPIADALWHVGQVVTFRRSAGNPLPKGVAVLEGKKYD